MKHEFKFSFNQIVKIRASDEEGVVIGASAHSAAEDQYLLRYRAADGRAVESWWGVSALSA